MKLFPKSRGRRVATVLLLLAYTLLMAFGGCADKLILYPSTEPLHVRGTTRLEAATGDGRAIEIWTARSQGAAAGEPQAFALEFIGNASRAEYMAAAVTAERGDRPVEEWSVNYAR